MRVKVDRPMLSAILKRYGVFGSVIENTPIINGQRLDMDGVTPRIKVINKVTVSDGSSFVIKIVKEKEHPIHIIEQQSVFSQCLHKWGVRVPRRLMADTGKYCSIELVCGNYCSVTVEECLEGKELEVINEKYVEQLAQIMGNMHSIAVANECHIDLNTIWDIYDPHSDILQGYKHYLLFPKKYGDSHKGFDWGRYTAIHDTYLQKRNSLQKLWHQLPKYAVQGDFSTNNVIVHEDASISGVIDFNIAGDEVLVNDMVTQGIFVCYIMDLDKGLIEDDRKGLFDTFVREYLQTRVLSTQEKEVMNDIYSIVFPFLWTRIEILESCLHRGAILEANAFLEETWEILTTPYFV
jgi:Ser/Thr protein kinase RdoA (MazF antagonist)